MADGLTFPGGRICIMRESGRTTYCGRLCREDEAYYTAHGGLWRKHDAPARHACVREIARVEGFPYG